MMKTNEIASFEELKNRVFGKSNGTICHYTSYESLLMILKNKSFRLSRYDLMNDRAEKDLSKCVSGDCRYIISFTGTTSENVAMWALYGKHSSLKLRIEFARGSLINSVNDNFYFDPELNNKIPLWGTQTIPNDFSKKNFTLSDVVYYDKQKNTFRMNGSPLKNIVVSHDYIDQLAGTIKYDAWEYEKESRLAVVLHQNLSDIDFQNLTHVYAKLNDEFISKIKITYSPWINDVVFNQLKNSIDSIAGVPLIHQHSSLQGEITEL